MEKFKKLLLILDKPYIKWPLYILSIIIAGVWMVHINIIVDIITYLTAISINILLLIATLYNW